MTRQKGMRSLLVKWRLYNERKWQKRVIRQANSAAERAMKGRQRKFIKSARNADHYYHPKTNVLVTKDQVAADVERVGNWVRDKEIQRYIANPKALEEDERRDLMRQKRSRGLT